MISAFLIEMSREIIVSIKGSKSFVESVPERDEADSSYLSRLGTTLKSVQHDVNVFLTKAIEEEKQRQGGVDAGNIGIVDIDDDDDDADSSEEEIEQKNKRMKSC